MHVTILSDAAVAPNLAAGDSGVACAFVQMARAEGGDAYCLYRRGSAKHGPDGALVLQRSVDGGRSWQPPLNVFDRTDRGPPETVVCGGICCRGDELIVSFASVEMLVADEYIFGPAASAFPWHVNVSRSKDNGRTWFPPARIERPAFAARMGVASSPFPSANGDLCVPLEVGLQAGPQATAACFSDDGGRSFSDPELIAGDAEGELSLCDARFARLGDGSYLMHLWSFRYDTEETVNVHESRSSDGRTWSTPTPTTLVGQISQPLQLPSGLLVTVCNHRQTQPGSHLWWSHDRGRTWSDCTLRMWDAALARVTGQPGQPRRHSQAEEVWDALPRFAFGTPNLLHQSDGTVLLTYWATLDDIPHIRACLFTLE